MTIKTKWNKGSVRMTLFRHQNGKCCYCEEQMIIGGHDTNPKSATREHLKRVADGGTHRIGNLAMACRECNQKRGKKSWLEWKTIKMGETIEV